MFATLFDQKTVRANNTNLLFEPTIMVFDPTLVFMHEEKYINSKYRKTNMVIVVVDKHISYYRHWTRKLEK